MSGLQVVDLKFITYYFYSTSFMPSLKRRISSFHLPIDNKALLLPAAAAVVDSYIIMISSSKSEYSHL